MCYKSRGGTPASVRAKWGWGWERASLRDDVCIEPDRYKDATQEGEKSFQEEGWASARK